MRQISRSAIRPNSLIPGGSHRGLSKTKIRFEGSNNISQIAPVFASLSTFFNLSGVRKPFILTMILVSHFSYQLRGDLPKEHLSID
jgi:hypothetical protein